jgi:hypothetical protein
MPVTEFSRLALKGGLSEDQQTSARQGLSRAKQLMETFTGHDFYIFREIEDSNHIYIVGQWASVEHHMNTWIPSEANQGLLKDLGSLVEVDFLFHIDVSVGSIPPSKEAPIFSIGKHVMDSGKRPGFEDTFNSRRSSLEAHAQGSISGGWRIEKEPGREEFVLFVPWKYVLEAPAITLSAPAFLLPLTRTRCFRDIDQHVAFAKTKEFQEYAEIRDYLVLDATEIRHVALMELPSPATEEDVV